MEIYTKYRNKNETTENSTVSFLKTWLREFLSFHSGNKTIHLKVQNWERNSDLENFGSALTGEFPIQETIHTYLQTSTFF